MSKTVNIRDKAVSAISWNVINQIVTQIVSLVVSVVMARLLSPEEFGTVGLITVFTGFAAIFLELGLGSALVQKKEINETDLSTVFWFTLSMGLLLTLLFAGLSGLLSSFYDRPALKSITIVLSFNFLIRSFAIVQNTLFLKDIDFKILTIRNIITVLVSGGVAILLAWYHYGVWSIVAQSLVASFLATTFLWTISSWRPKFIFSWKALQEMRKFSLNLVANNTLNYWVRNLDNFLIGKFIGISALGIYSKAYALMLLPLNNVSRVISKVLFPSFSSIQEDIPRIRSIYFKVTRSIAFITFPLMVGLLLVAEDFVLVFFGRQWTEMAPILQIMCVPGLLQSIGTLNGSIYQALGRTDLQFKVASFLKVIQILFLIGGVFWGIKGVAWAYAIANYLLLYPSYYYPLRLIDTSFKALALNVSKILICSFLMGLAVYSIEFLILDWSPVRKLLLQVICGVIIYLLLAVLMKVKAVDDLKYIFMEKFGKKLKVLLYGNP